MKIENFCSYIFKIYKEEREKRKEGMQILSNKQREEERQEGSQRDEIKIKYEKEKEEGYQGSGEKVKEICEKQYRVFVNKIVKRNLLM